MAYSLFMPERPTKPKTQKTPKGAEIPVPTRGEVYRDLGELAKGAKPLPTRREASAPERDSGA